MKIEPEDIYRDGKVLSDEEAYVKKLEAENKKLKASIAAIHYHAKKTKPPLGISMFYPNVYTTAGRFHAIWNECEEAFPELKDIKL